MPHAHHERHELGAADESLLRRPWMSQASTTRAREYAAPRANIPLSTRNFRTSSFSAAKQLPRSAAAAHTCSLWPAALAPPRDRTPEKTGQGIRSARTKLYYAAFGASADKVFASQEQHPYVGGEFVWTGWDYLGEPTPFDSSRSSYSGIIDLAGFKKDRFYLYQAHWRPDFPMAHILPHWTWPERAGQITPVHVFTSGDEGELFLNGKSLG